MASSSYLNLIDELIRSNGWEDQLLVEWVENSIVRIRLSQNHPVAPLDIVNDYLEGTHSLEQVQQECLRAIRTGRPGI